MQVTNSNPIISDFPIYQNRNYAIIQKQNNIKNELRIYQYKTETSSLELYDLKQLESVINWPKHEKGSEKEYFWNVRLIINIYNKFVVSRLMKQINENVFSSSRISFVNYCVWIQEMYNSTSEINKCKLLIDLGERVNDEKLLNMTPLAYSLDNKLDDSWIELLIKSGGLVYNGITKEQQTRVNAVMQPVIANFNDKLKVSLELFQDKNSIMNFLPKELKNIIHLASVNSFHPEVVLKILKMNKSI